MVQGGNNSCFPWLEMLHAERMTLRSQALITLALVFLVSQATDAREETLDQGVLELAMSGYNKAVAAGEVDPSSLLTIIDYSRPSTEERLFVFDPVQGTVLHTSLVAHGKNSGANLATQFSNEVGSLRTSPGFYTTGETYQGKHGYSLKLRGLEGGINDNAMRRHIVIHGADYVSEKFAARHGRLGRSWGCPALPRETAGQVIDLIKDGSCLFIFCDDPGYLAQSAYIDSSVD